MPIHNSDRTMASTGEAITEFTNALGFDYSSSAEAWYAQGVLHALAGEDFRAEKAYLHALARDPLRGGVHYSLGLLYMDGGSAELGYKHLKRAVELRPRSVSLRLRVCQLCLKHQHHPGLIENCERLLQQDPHPTLAATLLGWLVQAHSAVGNRELALAAAQQAAELVPKNPQSLNNLGVLLIRGGRYAQAVQVLTDAKALAPELDFVGRNLRLAQKLEGAVAPAGEEMTDALSG